jgi:hypothetical protein
MTKLFTILDTKEEPGFGTLINFLISITKEIDINGPQTFTLNSTVLVPTGEDIDSWLTSYLTKSGWIVQE